MIINLVMKIRKNIFYWKNEIDNKFNSWLAFNWFPESLPTTPNLMINLVMVPWILSPLFNYWFSCNSLLHFSPALICWWHAWCWFSNSLSSMCLGVGYLPASNSAYVAPSLESSRLHGGTSPYNSSHLVSDLSSRRRLQYGATNYPSPPTRDRVGERTYSPVERSEYSANGARR